MLALLIAAAVVAQTPVDAERAFAADAQALGQWTAFRKWSTDDAIMFTPKPNNAHEFLKDRKDPPTAIDWWPTESFLSCDGRFAANRGGWVRADGTAGFFVTIWRRNKRGEWRWIADGGDTVTAPLDRPTEPTIVRPDCQRRPAIKRSLKLDAGGTVVGASRDRSLGWFWVVDESGARDFAVSQWDGENFKTVIDYSTAPPK